MQPEGSFQGDASPLGPGAFLEVADRIGLTLCRDSLWSGRSCTWMGWSLDLIDGSFRPNYRTSDTSLYSGLPGIALFLSRLYAFTGDPVQKETALGAVRNLIERIEAAPSSAGFYSGSLGAAWALAGIGDQLGCGALVERSLALAEDWGARVPDPTSTDLLNGSAGIVVGLADLGRRYGRPSFFDLATRHGDFLVSQASRTPGGVGWVSPEPGSQPLTGLSHGTSGYAWALALLHQVRPKDAYREMARAAIEHERSLFDERAGNWPDLRSDPGHPGRQLPHACAWCHGATGIGLARLRLRQLLGDEPQLWTELDAALRSASAILVNQQNGAIPDFSYCHGSAAHAELLLDFGIGLDRPEMFEAACRFGDIAAQTFPARGLPWPCGVSGAGATPGLMLGTAGIGWFYLRLHDPTGVPSLLVVGSPSQSVQPSRSLS